MQRYLCPVCRSPRQMGALRDHLSMNTHVRLGSVVLTAATIAFFVSGTGLALRLLVFYLPIWALLEFVHGVRVREAAKCPTCSFDPVLYRRDWRAARTRIERKLGQSLEQHLRDLDAKKQRLAGATAAAASTESKVPVETPELPQPSLF